MKKKYFAYAILPALALIVASTSIASAQGWFRGLNSVNPEECVQRHEEMFNNQAEFLGLSIEDLKNAWVEGKNFHEIAEEQGITQEQIREHFAEKAGEQMRNRLQILVDNEVINQEQADQRLESMKNKFGENGERMGFYQRGYGKKLGISLD